LLGGCRLWLLGEAATDHPVLQSTGIGPALVEPEHLVSEERVVGAVQWKCISKAFGLLIEVAWLDHWWTKRRKLLPIDYFYVNGRVIYW
jgi:hypothetical protein